MGSDLSIAINLYDYTNYKQLEAVLCTIRMQIISIDIILSEQFYRIKPNNNVLNLAKKYQCKYILSRTEINKKGLAFNLGKMRNIAASNCNTPYIYFSDADILFLNPNYMKNIVDYLKSQEHIALFHPLMFRLKKEDTENIMNSIISGKKIHINASKCFVRYDLGKGVINDKEIKNEYESDYYKSWLNNFTEKSINESYLKAYKNNYINIHGGGTIVSIDDFWKIGGYGETFFHWGCEDDDFHKKLSSICLCQEMCFILNQYDIVHLEHELCWDKEMYLINNRIANNRKKLDVNEIIKKDLSMSNSFASAYINKNLDFIEKCIIKFEDFSYGQ